MEDKKQSCTLMVKHLPSELSEDDKVDLLKSFGAKNVSVMGLTGPMKHRAFATFACEEDAVHALHALHQATLLGCRLNVEFSKSNVNIESGKPLENCPKGQTKDVKQPLEKSVEFISKKLDNLSEKWNIPYEFNSKLKYSYPPPNAAVISNIANAIFTVPKFYTQVLHLMNKMHLPCPFGSPVPSPLFTLQQHNLETTMDIDDNIEMVDMEDQSSEESELEADNDVKPATVKPNVVKRKKRQLDVGKKKVKLQNFVSTSVAKTSEGLKPDDVFEQKVLPVARKIDLKLSSTLPEKTVDKMAGDIMQVQPEQRIASEVVTDKSGFGKIMPQINSVDLAVDNEQEATDIFEGHFITHQQLEKGRISPKKMKELNVFKNYNAGIPAMRVYIKNIAKQSTEADLRYIFGRYVNWDSETEKQHFSIVLLKEGRMKGQAFVSLPSEEAAKAAVKETNAYVLNSKPMVVQFATSGKAEKDKKSIVTT